MGLLIDLIPNSTNYYYDCGIIWQTVRRITNEILGVKGLRLGVFSVIIINPWYSVLLLAKLALRYYG